MSNLQGASLNYTPWDWVKSKGEGYLDSPIVGVPHIGSCRGQLEQSLVPYQGGIIRGYPIHTLGADRNIQTVR